LPFFIGFFAVSSIVRESLRFSFHFQIFFLSCLNLSLFLNPKEIYQIKQVNHRYEFSDS
jgi:hypothetical protein